MPVRLSPCNPGAVEEKQDPQTGFLVDCECQRALDLDPDSELLVEFSHQSFAGSLAVVDLATWKLPQAAHVAALGPLRKQDAILLVADDGRDHGDLST